jgi:hypothetical protein
VLTSELGNGLTRCLLHTSIRVEQFKGLPFTSGLFNKSLDNLTLRL